MRYRTRPYAIPVLRFSCLAAAALGAASLATSAYAAPPQAPQPAPGTQAKSPLRSVLKPTVGKKDSRHGKGDKAYQLGSMTVTGSQLKILCTLRKALSRSMTFDPAKRHDLVCEPTRYGYGEAIHCQNAIAVTHCYQGGPMTGFGQLVKNSSLGHACNGMRHLMGEVQGAEDFFVPGSRALAAEIKASPAVKTVCGAYDGTQGDDSSDG